MQNEEGNTDIAFKTTGCSWLSPVSERVGVPLDQVNFIACQLFGLAVAFWFRLALGPHRVSAELRHAVAIVFGAAILIFCFGWYAVHVFLLVLACYGIMITASVHNLHRYTLIASLGYLTLCQVSRVFIFDYGILSTDFSGPLMIITQKVTTLAFQVHDGMSRKQEELTDDQRHLAVRSRPSLLEYLSYNINFLSILVGPCCLYKDYTEFIRGRHVKRVRDSGSRQNGGDKVPEPSPVRTVVNKLLVCVCCLLWFFIITKAFPISYNVDPQFVSDASFVTRLAYALISIQAARPKFYFAWTLADAVHNAAGFGVSGVNARGEVSWDLVSNVHIWEIETATSFKSFIDNWNIQTALWLKRICQFSVTSLMLSSVTLQCVSRSSPVSPHASHIRAVGDLAWSLPRILLYIHHRYTHHLSSSHCAQKLPGVFLVFSPAQDLLRCCDLGCHSDGHLLHGHAFPSAGHQTQHAVLQIDVLSCACHQYSGCDPLTQQT
ncbi:lysophospholipid acyltransferase 1-like isoform X1 [Pimephales promelas]|uniref:lysophospholipid acyltransferase 1-like isoform X1 n=1 Tax=Pimephales promelas TaxID=90988 RepID=UPI0019555310|nr:lysophospholipid acyltransferase 1-like isoform X1 [Pimephales promelas]